MGKLVRINLFPYIIIFFAVILDQLSKVFAGKYLAIVCNRGIAFGINFGNSIIYLLVLGVCIYMLFREKALSRAVALSLIFGGGLSNYIDRLFAGCVRDFISAFSFPTFNLADVFISGGVFLLLINYLRKNES